MVPGLLRGDIALGGKLTLTTEDVVGFGDFAVETGRLGGENPPTASIWTTARTGRPQEGGRWLEDLSGHLKQQHAEEGDRLPYP
jgi:hypothetical protein